MTYICILQTLKQDPGKNSKSVEIKVGLIVLGKVEPSNVVVVYVISCLFYRSYLMNIIVGYF